MDGDAEAIEIMRGLQQAGCGASLEVDGHIYSDSWVAHCGQWEGYGKTPLEAVKSAYERFKVRSLIIVDHLWSMGFPEDELHCCDYPQSAHPPGTNDEEAQPAPASGGEVADHVYESSWDACPEHPKDCAHCALPPEQHPKEEAAPREMRGRDGNS